MDFSKNIKAYLASFPLSSMNGSQKFLAVAAHCAYDSADNNAGTSDVRRQWQKTILKINYNPAYHHGAQKEGWINSTEAGMLSVTDEGLSHLNDLLGLSASPAASSNGGLYIFERKSTHSFDKFLRGTLAGAKKEVLIDDSYVNETIFDTVLDSIQPASLKIRMIYGRKMGTFDAKMTRFQVQYTDFQVKRYTRLHDRFILVDGKGFIFGPSIKDAADKSPALVVAMGKKDSAELLKFYQKLWSTSTP